jgi:hypothetical protein
MHIILRNTTCCVVVYIATNHFILLGHKFIKMSNLNAFDIDETKFGGRKYLSGSSSSSSLPKSNLDAFDIDETMFGGRKYLSGSSSSSSLPKSNLDAFDIDETKFGGRKYLTGSSSSSSLPKSNLDAFNIDETKFGGRKYLSGSSSSSSLPKTVAPTSDVAFVFSIDHNNNNDFSISDKIGHTQNASIPFRATKIKTIAEMEKMTDDSICLLKTADIIRKPEHVHLSNETSNATSSDKLKAKAFDESFSTLAVMLFKLCLLYSVFLRSKICTAPSNEVVAKIVRLAVNVSKQFILRIYW